MAGVVLVGDPLRRLGVCRVAAVQPREERTPARVGAGGELISGLRVEGVEVSGEEKRRLEAVLIKKMIIREVLTLKQHTCIINTKKNKLCKNVLKVITN